MAGLFQKRGEWFEPTSIAVAAKEASIIMLLIPDQAQKKVFETDVLPNLASGDTVVFAHGYSVHFKEIVPPKDVNILLLAPRMPGKPIREYYLENGGVPAFGSVYQDATGNAKEILLALAKGNGFTRSGLMEVSFKEETAGSLYR